MRKVQAVIALLAIALVSVLVARPAAATSFNNRTPANSSLGNIRVNSVTVSGSTIYASTNGGGLSISTDGGTTFTNKTTGAGLGSNILWGVALDGGNIYVATTGGVSISTNGGLSFTNYTAGLGSTNVYGVFVSGGVIYAATAGGVSTSPTGAVVFTPLAGLGSVNTRGVFVVGATVYAATSSGLAISTDGGTNFTTYTTADGLGSNTVRGAFASGGTIYAATDGGLSITGASAASGPNVPTAPMQAYGRDVNGKCVTNAPVWVNWSGIATQQHDAWGASWQQWPNNGTGGYVCERQPYFTTIGTWSVQ